MKTTQTDSFDTISLDEMGRVKLMNRTDTKYWFNASALQAVLEAVQTNYFILNMNNEVTLPYSTVYFDTEENKMYNAHHNGKLNRFKIRRRSYVSSGVSFLEIKFKNNKGRTLKKRISSDSNNLKFTAEELAFIHSQTPFSGKELNPSLINNFSRLTLVNKNFKERCTIDFNLRFEIDNKNVTLENLVIVEIKSEGKSAFSPLALALREQRIKTSGFSKYCVGRTVTNAALKRNAFKGKIRRIEKTIQSNINLYHFN